MAKQTEKQRQLAQLAGDKDFVMWKGQLCEIVGNEPVTRSDGTVVLCAKIKVLGLPLHQGLRVVLESELELQ